MPTSLMLTYPPEQVGPLWTGELEERLKRFGGIEVFLHNAAYFVSVKDFSGYLEVSLEIFDNQYMPYFEENTISDSKYKEHRNVFKQTVYQIWCEIYECLSGYAADRNKESILVTKSIGDKTKYIITLK